MKPSLAFARIKETRILRKPFRRWWHAEAEHWDLPKTIWTYWAAGRDKAPELVKMCMNSWEIMNPSWRMIVLDDGMVADYVDLSDVEDISLPIQKRANVLRNRLMRDHGGVWADATVACTLPLDHWIFMAMQIDLFMFSRPSSSRIISSWFIMSQPHGPLMTKFERVYTDFLANPPLYQQNLKPPFYSYHYLFEYTYITDRRFRKRFDHMPRIWAEPLHHFQRWLQAKDRSGRAELRDLVGLPMHKLDWKRPADLDELRQVLSGLDSRLAEI